MRYLSGASTGTIVAGGYGRGTNSSQLNLPSSLYFDNTTNSLVIANAGANNIVRWVIGANSWTLIAGSASGLAGTTSPLFSSPRDVTLDSMGNVYVADSGNNRVQFFLAGQLNGTTIATVPNNLYSVAFDRQSNVYASDYHNAQVLKFLRC